VDTIGVQPFILSSATLHLRPLEAADEDAVFQACQDTDVLRWTAALPVPYTREDAEAFVNVTAPRAWADETAFTWAIGDPTSGRFLGVVGLDEPAAGCPSIGYWLAPDGRGRGAAGQAVSAACRLAFDELGAEAVRWEALVGNEPSRRVAERVGFQVGEPVRRFLEQRGRWVDAWVATLLPDDQPVPDPPVLTDGVVTLRGWRAGDLDRVTSLIDEPIRQWTAFAGRSRQEVADWLEFSRRVRRPPDARFAIADAQDAAVGSLRLGQATASGAVSVGWWLGPAARGQGLAYRALRMALAWAAARGVPRFTAEIYDGNTASTRLADRLGMRCEGLRRAAWPARAGGRRDTWVYSLIPGDPGWPDA
jgi:RimJ/RimL family protein N-acetyltransferase